MQKSPASVAKLATHGQSSGTELPPSFGIFSQDKPYSSSK
jgi:hypothetical protein